ncbi:MAG TPA: cation diffusion facilitator family transporter [Xanthobacteraceae bacterium]|nr:cation diffusion facilitator family transporter [Xanthobacteraceae bacterium]
MHGGHGHSHDHAHNHGHAPADYGWAFALGIILNAGFVAIQFGYGYLANSLALISDAVHNLSDVLSLVLAWAAIWFGRKGPTAKRTYGYRRASILAALANAALLLVAVGAIVFEAVERLGHPQPVASTTVLWVAAAGIVVNGATALFFLRGREHDINIEGAFLHMAADAAVSLGVVIAALLIRWTGYDWIDPLASLVVAAVIVLSSWGLTRNAFNLAMDAVPSHIDSGEVRKSLIALDGVKGVHDLHIWAMSTTEVALTAHLVAPGTNSDQLIAAACHELETHFSIRHVTLQIESGEQACPLAPAHTV